MGQPCSAGSRAIVAEGAGDMGMRWALGGQGHVERWAGCAQARVGGMALEGVAGTCERQGKQR